MGRAQSQNGNLEGHMNQGTLNTQWGKILIDQLIRHGVDTFCLSPGFRSTPLALAAAYHPKAKTVVHYDERGASFYALGYAKATKKPVAIIVTSGTAVGNLMPAVMEAWAANIPLILLTSDRPAELLDTQANQTADQIKIFGDYVRYAFHFPSPSAEVSPNFIATTVAQAVLQTGFPLPGPVQLNCPFPEPFFSEEPELSTEVDKVDVELPHVQLEEKYARQWAETLNRSSSGAIVVGANGGTKEIAQLAEKLGWPILADTISGMRELAHPQTIPYYHHLLKTCPDLSVSTVLYFGDALVSKNLLKWISERDRLIHISGYAKRCDPHHAVKERVICSAKTFCNALAPHVEKRLNPLFKEWRALAEKIAFSLPGNPLTEPAVTNILEKHAQPGQALFFGNSMPVRDAEFFFFPKKPCGPLFANRGLSGIDGNIATLCGIAQQMPVCAVIGDQTLLHDLNSLALMKKTGHPVQLIVINNQGGGIFSFVAIGKKKEVLDPYFAAKHTLTFEKSAEAFGIPYHKVTERENLEKLLHTTQTCIIEVPTNREENFQLHQQIDKEIQECLASSFSTVS
jgi:2-succinyl-5-enolpyruvyl-6-hydroxy-3-cyclohexene-1-carboxylate synthase